MKIERNLTIRAPADLVFLFLVHPDYVKLWIRSMHDWKCTSRLDLEDLTGTTFEDEGGGRSWHETITSYCYPSEYCSLCSSDAYEYQDDFFLREANGNTELTGSIDVTFKTLIWKVIGVLLSWSIRVDAKSNMMKLKRAVEKYAKDNPEKVKKK